MNVARGAEPLRIELDRKIHRGRRTKPIGFAQSHLLWIAWLVTSGPTGASTLRAGFVPDLICLLRRSWRLAVKETWPAFLLRNFQNFTNLFSPVHIQSRLSFLLVLAVVGIGSALVFLKRRGEEHTAYSYRLIPALFAGIIVLEMMILSLAGRYPFGGLTRHQYIAGPFLILAAFSVFDDVLAVVIYRLRARQKRSSW